MASLKEIAKHAGTSIRTVSRVIRKQKNVSEMTRKKVEKVLEKLNYVPNIAARTLKTGKTYDIAVIIGSYDELHIEKLASFEKKTREFGYRVNVLFSHYGENEVKIIEHIKELRPAGIAIFSGGIFPSELLKYPSIGVGIRDKRITCVELDRAKGIYDAVDYLFSKGIKKIAYLGPEGAASQERLQGYYTALKAHKIKPLIYETPEKVLNDIAKNPGIIVFSDAWAMELLQILNANAVKIPDEISVIGFDDRAFAKLASPPLTTLAQPNAAIGELAAKILNEKINNKREIHKKLILLPMKLVIRKSA
ncbi:MAG TPA: LacI family DNA-binding transcriptional regulator [Victivallales bacterium]|nr:LacI family DNA-binding transcriptional regulator [Victivallales bacterium]HRU02317.1 LacI family DNA-binding transcriptional regulator [Victivallales bacterium]